MGDRIHSGASLEAGTHFLSMNAGGKQENSLDLDAMVKDYWPHLVDDLDIVGNILVLSICTCKWMFPIWGA